MCYLPDQMFTSFNVPYRIIKLMNFLKSTKHFTLCNLLQSKLHWWRNILCLLWMVKSQVNLIYLNLWSHQTMNRTKALKRNHEFQGEMFMNSLYKFYFSYLQCRMKHLNLYYKHHKNNKTNSLVIFAVNIF